MEIRFRFGFVFISLSSRQGRYVPLFRLFWVNGKVYINRYYTVDIDERYPRDLVTVSARIVRRRDTACVGGSDIIFEEEKEIKVLWDGSKLFDGRSRWFVAFKPKTRKFLVHYRDGDKRWEKILDESGDDLR